MSTPLQPKDKIQGASTTEIYGAENLPVLVRLPDVSTPVAVHVPVPVTDTPAATDAPPAEVQRQQSRQTAVQERRERVRSRSRRQSRKAKSPGWLRGASNFALAVVLASILFGIFVTFKEWNKKAPKGQAPVGTGRVEAPVIDIGQPSLDPPVMLTEQEVERMFLSAERDRDVLEEVDAAALLRSDPTPEAGDEPAKGGGSRLARQPIMQPNVEPAIGQADSARSNEYPTTGIDPVRREPQTVRRPDGVDGRRGTIPTGGFRHADRSGSETFPSQHR